MFKVVLEIDTNEFYITDTLNEYLRGLEDDGTISDYRYTKIPQRDPNYKAIRALVDEGPAIGVTRQ